MFSPKVEMRFVMEKKTHNDIQKEIVHNLALLTVVVESKGLGDVTKFNVRMRDMERS